MTNRLHPLASVDRGVEQPVGDDTLVWTHDRVRGMTVHAAPLPELDGQQRLTAGDARRAYNARFCTICWPVGGDAA